MVVKYTHKLEHIKSLSTIGVKYFYIFKRITESNYEWNIWTIKFWKIASRYSETLLIEIEPINKRVKDAVFESMCDFLLMFLKESGHLF